MPALPPRPPAYGDLGEQCIETMKFDAFVEKNDIQSMALAKIDVKQAEKLVIDGMNKTLEKYPSELLIEVLSEDSLWELNDTLSPLGYGFAVTDDDSQEIRINQLENYKKVDNALFSTLSPEDLEALCRIPEPLPKKRGGKMRRSKARRRLAGMARQLYRRLERCAPIIRKSGKAGFLFHLSILGLSGRLDLRAELFESAFQPIQELTEPLSLVLQGVALYGLVAFTPQPLYLFRTLGFQGL